MNTPKYLDTATKLLDAVESRLLSPEPSDPAGPKEWLWLGRAMRAILNEPLQDSEEVRSVGNRLIDLVVRMRKEEDSESASLEHVFLNAVQAATSANGTSLSRCLMRDDAMSLETVANHFVVHEIIWESDSWENRNGISEEKLCELLVESDAIACELPDPALRVFDGATASLDPNDPCGDGWLACVALWHVSSTWWMAYVHADLADVLARNATNHDEASTALVMMPEVPTEVREEWASFVKDLVAARCSPNSDARTLCEAGEPDFGEYDY